LVKSESQQFKLNQMLVKAVSIGSLPLVKKLLKSGADVSFYNFQSVRWAFADRRLDIFEELLKSDLTARVAIHCHALLRGLAEIDECDSGYNKKERSIEELNSFIQKVLHLYNEHELENLMSDLGSLPINRWTSRFAKSFRECYLSENA
jgi:hypothetical protein